MQRYVIAALFFFMIAGNGCSNNKYAGTNRVYKKQARSLAKLLKQRPNAVDSTPAATDWAGTTNFGMRKANFVIIHYTAQNACDSTLRTFTLPAAMVSAHYVICRDGTIHHMLNDYLRAWHAGNSKWGNLVDVNSSSIGIEIDNNGFEPFTEIQVKSLLVLLAKLKEITISLPQTSLVILISRLNGRSIPEDIFRGSCWRKMVLGTGMILLMCSCRPLSMPCSPYASLDMIPAIRWQLLKPLNFILCNRIRWLH